MPAWYHQRPLLGVARVGPSSPALWHARISQWILSCIMTKNKRVNNSPFIESELETTIFYNISWTDLLILVDNVRLGPLALCLSSRRARFFSFQVNDDNVIRLFESKRQTNRKFKFKFWDGKINKLHRCRSQGAAATSRVYWVLGWTSGIPTLLELLISQNWLRRIIWNISFLIIIFWRGACRVWNTSEVQLHLWEPVGTFAEP